ncbi:hypothetical protein VMCG_07799 [Cytospora schulzeri]|uniref:Uncharacterized protein n=1 Tax=Cytospora schulzeri TaxID=448051 RepID=A0A423VZP3_9PEZI|nr:hypothetical protein VMCG_07799 [Valsa malicola]
MKQLVSKLRRSLKLSRDPRSIAGPTSPSRTLIPDMPEPDVVGSSPSPEVTCTAQQICDSGLESLPPEVRRYLLSTLDLPRLKALVRASPTFHQQYLLDRKYLLCRSLEKTLGSVTVDAYAVHQSAARPTNTTRNVTRFLEKYSEQISQRCLPLFDKLSLDEALAMVIFYLNYVKPITEHHVRWTLDNLAEKAGNTPHDTQHAIELTRSESMRFTRATYRFQLLCQLIGPDGWISWLSRQRMAQVFLDVLEPWEVEEFATFYQWAQEVYDKVLNAVRWDLHPDNPKFDDQGRPPTPEGAFDMEISFNRENYLEGTTLRGLSLLRKVLFNIKDHEHLVSTMQKQIASSYIPISSIVGILGDTQQSIRRKEHPSERDEMRKQRVPFPFRGDGEPDTPPLAWTTIWGDTYSNLSQFRVCLMKAQLRTFFDQELVALCHLREEGVSATDEEITTVSLRAAVSDWNHSEAGKQYLLDSEWLIDHTRERLIREFGYDLDKPPFGYTDEANASNDEGTSDGGSGSVGVEDSASQITHATGTTGMTSTTSSSKSHIVWSQYKTDILLLLRIQGVPYSKIIKVSLSFTNPNN